ncbi:MAG: response regulator [Deltaproteobacteria bacterium]
MTEFTVLLVDDEEGFIRTLAQRLRKRNVEPMTAVTGQEALRLIQETAPDVMAVDLRMPDMSGIEILRRMKKNHPEIQVVVLTGHSWIEDEEEARALGAFACLEKPLGIEELLATLRKAYAEKLGGSTSSVRSTPGSEPETGA